MAKKIRFALEMEDGIEVRTLEELKSHFSLSRVIEYMKEGKISTWLRDRYCDELADKLEAVDLDGNTDYAKEICELFGIEYNDAHLADIEKGTERAARIKKLREYTEDKTFDKYIDHVAFDQDELYDLLDEEQTEIYLCGERFSIPTSKEGVTYIGINHPVAVVDSDIEVNWKEKSIVLRDVIFDEKYQVILDSKKRKKESQTEQSAHNTEDHFISEITEEINADDLTDENITSITQINADETKVIQNKSIHISAFIKCEGVLKIDHCVLYYNESEPRGEITLTEGASIIIQNSKVICKGFEEKPFITCEYGAYGNEVVWENTTFIDCGHFIETNHTKQFKMEKCLLKNCYVGFAEIGLESEGCCDILDNHIVQDCLSQFYVTHIKDIWAGYHKPLLRIGTSGYGGRGAVRFCENNIRHETAWLSNLDLEENELNRYELDYLSCNYAKVSECIFEGITFPISTKSIKNCKFIGCKRAFEAARCESQTIIEECVFENCTDVIVAEDNTKIVQCSFIGCYNRIINASTLHGGVQIEYSQFRNIRNNAESSLESSLLYGVPACIIFRRGNEYNSHENSMKKCIFDGAEMEDNFLIAADEYKEPAGSVATIEECEFVNCSTKRSSRKLIKQYIQYYTVFKKEKSFLAINIRDCRGIDSEGRI